MNDKKAMNRYMNRVAPATFSYFDTGNKPSEYAESKRFYHGFALGLMVELANRHSITSNRKGGFGRYDVMLDDTVAAALSQIDEKHYSATLEAPYLSS